MTTRLQPRQKRSNESICKILDAAEWLIARDGQASFTSAELATQAGMSIGRVYYWYVDLDAVMDATAKRIVDDLIALPQPTTSKATVDWLESLVRQHPAFVVLATSGVPHGNRVALVDALANGLRRVLDYDRYAVKALLGLLIDLQRFPGDSLKSELDKVLRVVRELQTLPEGDLGT